MRVEHAARIAELEGDTARLIQQLDLRNLKIGRRSNQRQRASSGRSDSVQSERTAAAQTERPSSGQSRGGVTLEPLPVGVVAAEGGACALVAK